MTAWRPVEDEARPRVVVAIGRWWKQRSAVFKFGATAMSLMAAFYAAVYYPYAETSLPGRWLAAYVVLQAQVCGAVLHLLDGNVSVEGVLIRGAFPLAIVLDCAAPDTMALFAAATLAFPATIGRKLTGLVAGLAAIAVVNIGRITFLYVVGVRWPHLFGVMHEEILQIVLVLTVACCFVLYASWIRRSGRPARGPYANESLPG